MNLADFFISIAWDTKGLDKGERDIDAKTKKVRDSAKKAGDDTEAQAKRVGSTIRTVRNEVAGLFLAFAGANSIKGFLSEMIGGAAAAGRLADNLGISIEKLSGVRNAARAVGGTDADADTALGALNKLYEDRKLRGDHSKDPELGFLGVTRLDDPIEVLNQLAAASERMSKQDFVNVTSSLGIPMSVINSLEKGRKGYAALTAEGERNANLHKKDAEAAQAFDKSLNDLVTTIKGSVQPWITKMVDGLNGFLASGKSINDAIPDWVKQLGVFGGAVALLISPWAKLAAIIGVAAIALKDWNTQQNMSAEDRKRFDAEGDRLRGQFVDQLARGDIMGAINTIGEGFNGRIANGGLGAGAPSADVASQYQKLAKYGGFKADAIWHGLGAESGWNPDNVNPDSGAYGIAQWLGPRLKKLRARYGNGKISVSDQMDFLISEIDGGDAGGASVRNSSNYAEALSNFIGLYDPKHQHGGSFGFERPDWTGRLGDMRRAGAYRPGSGGGAGATSNSSTVNINGPIHIATAATDAKGIARDLNTELNNRNLTIQSNTGIAP